MAIVTNFTADVESGETPLTVTFTDTSTGSPTNWIWDFGDGFTSNIQNPSHTYTEDGTYTVSLRAFISAGTTDIAPSGGSKESKSGGEVTGFNAAYDAFVAASWGSTGIGANLYRVTKITTTNYAFIAFRLPLIYDFTSHSGKIILIKGKYRQLIDIIPASAFKNATNKSFPNDSGGIYTHWFDATTEAGGSFTLNISDLSNYAILPNIGGILKKVGWELIPDSYSGAKATAHSFSDNDIETKINFINVGVDPPIAAFSGTPKTKRDSLTSQFTDESTNTPTSWSWKRRPSGIQANYVEFSTNENPSEGFDITDPTP